MTIAVLVITNGREECLAETVQTMMRHLVGPVTEWWMFDDTGDERYRTGLVRRYPTFSHIHEGPPQGFGGAIRRAWAVLRIGSSARYVFHVEDDFRFLRPVDLGAMATVLEQRPEVAQMALRRQPWNADERAAGGVVERDPDAFTEYADAGHRWLAHRAFWTTNPSLYRRTLCGVGWPTGDHSEGRFGLQLLEQGTPEATAEQVRMGYWGARSSGVWVEHIGHRRIGGGY